MAKGSAITLYLKGPRTSADLSDFANIVSTLRNCLRNVSRCVCGQEDIEFDVSDLRHSSAEVEVSPQYGLYPTDVLDQVTATFKDTIKALEFGKLVDPLLDFRAINAFNGFSGVARRQGVEFRIGSTQLTKKYVDHIGLLLKVENPTFGSVTGHLEAVSIHNESRFTLYPPVAGEEIDCVFPRSDLENVLKAVDRDVTVYGKLFYAQTKAFPARVEAETFDILPESYSLPTLLDARGILKTQDATGDEW